MSRITSVISPTSPCSEENYYTTGNQVCNGYIAINNGGMKGLGLGNSIQKYLYLPEAHTDFIFCIIIEELGLRMGLFILLLYLILLTRIILIGKRSLNNRDSLICYGAAFYIFIHIMVNLCCVFGMLPMTGVPLPFMSYGGSYTWCLIIILSFVQRVNIETKMLSMREVGKEKKKA
jgi:cell division protein FtsW